MRLSWNEFRARAARFAGDGRTPTSKKAKARPSNEFFEVFGVARRRVASFEEPVKKLGDERGFIDLFWKVSTLLVESSRHGCPTPPFRSDADQRSELHRKTNRHQFGTVLPPSLAAASLAKSLSVSRQCSYISLDRVGRVDNGRRVAGRIEDWTFGWPRAPAVRLLFPNGCSCWLTGSCRPRRSHRDCCPGDSQPSGGTGRRTPLRGPGTSGYCKFNALIQHLSPRLWTSNNSHAVAGASRTCVQWCG
jgi:hypothetical protein